MPHIEMRPTEPTFAAALNRALHEASKHTNWARAEVVLVLGTHEGPHEPPEMIDVRVFGVGEREPDWLSLTVCFPYESGGPDLSG